MMKLANPSDECFQLLYQEFGVSEDKLNDYVMLLKDWYDQQPHLPRINQDMCVYKALLLRSKFSVERAKQALDLHSTLKSAIPEYFSNRDPYGAELQAHMDTIDLVCLPQCTAAGYRVYLGKLKASGASVFNLSTFLKLLFMMADNRIAHHEDYAIGEIYIVDLCELAVGHVTAMTFTQLRKADVMFTKGYCSRMAGVHFINPPPLVEMFVPLLVSACGNKKLKSRILVHAKLDALYKHVDREILPADYGGQERTRAAIWADWRADLESRRDWFREQEQTCLVDETKRPGKSIDKNELFGFEGTFKQLAVD